MLPLAEASTRTKVGTKAARLAAVVRAGFEVPEAVVVTTDALAHYDEASGTMCPAFVEQLTAAAGDLGYPLAVRSSAVEEDLDRASFAGLYETVLNVENDEQLLAAVRRCWLSAHASSVAAYLQGTTQAGGQPMGIIVQRQVPADFAGVAFSADPRSGDRSRVIVETVTGSGERLVSGAANVERWLLGTSGARREGGTENVLDEAQATRVARLVRDVASYVGRPQDIEWAMTGRRLYLLQARAITSLPDVEPVEVPVRPPPGGWTRQDTHFSAPPSPLFASIFIPLHRRAVNPVFKEFGIPVDNELTLEVIGGWFYLGADSDTAEPSPPPPAWLIGIAARVDPSLRAATRRARRYLRERRDEEHVRSWWNAWRPRIVKHSDELDGIDLKALDSRQLGEHVDACLALFEEMVDVHFRLAPAEMLASAELAHFCQDTLDWQPSHTVRLLAGISHASSEPARALAGIADTVRKNAAALDIVTENPTDALSQMAREAPDVMASLIQYQRRYGLRTTGFDVIDPLLRERPRWTWNLLRGQVAGAIDAQEACARQENARQRTLEATRRALGNGERRHRFEALLARAETAYPAREDNEFWMFCAAGLLRTAFLEVGRRLRRQGHTKRSDDVMYLHVEEVNAWMRGGRPPSAPIDRRRGERLWALENRPPAQIKPPMQLPDVRYCPAPLQTVIAALAFSMKHGESSQAATGERLTGAAASAGSYTGPVRLVHSHDDLERVRPGDVLVCRLTTSAWSALFGQIGALVTESGGILSHPAIIAREFSLPAVLGVADAMTQLQDGQIVTVDGAKGHVERAAAGKSPL